MLVWQAHKNKVRALVFSPDGARLASAAETTTSVGLWEAHSGKKLGELRGKWGHTSGVAWSPDGKLLATSTMDYRLVIWDAKTHNALSAADSGRLRHSPAFTPDGSGVAVAGPDGCAVWADPAIPHPETLGPYAGSEWKSAKRFMFDSDNILTDDFDSLAFSPDGKWVVTNGHGRAVIWNRRSALPSHLIQHNDTDALTTVAFSPDSARVAFSYAKLVEIYPLKGKGKSIELKGHTMVVRAVRFTPDSRTVMTAGSDGKVHFWDSATGTLTRSFDWGIGRVYSADISPDGLTCAAGGENGQVVVWDVDA